jgi:hypothetical protein
MKTNPTPTAASTATPNPEALMDLVYYAFSTMVCTPNSLSQEGRAALGAQAGEAKLRAVAEEGGFTRFRRATETPFNLILEAKA